MNTAPLDLSSLSDDDPGLIATLDLVPVATFIVDWEARTVVYANPAALEAIGAPAAEVLGRPCHRFICPTEEGRCPIADLGLTVNRAECEALTAAGRSFPVVKTVKPLTLGGRPHLIESFVDISEQKRLAADLLASVGRFRSAVESANDAIICLDERGMVVVWNPAAEAMFGYGADEALRRHIAFLMPQRTRDRWGEGWRRAMRSGSEVRAKFESVGVRKDGAEFPLEFSVAVSRAATGGEFVAVFRDTTERQYGQKLQAAGYSLSEAAHLAGSSQEFLTFAHQALGELVPADGAFVARWLTETSEPEFIYSEAETGAGEGDALVAEVVRRTSAPLATTAEAVAVLAEERGQSETGTTWAACLAVPLVDWNLGALPGVLGLYRQEPGAAFSERDVETLMFLSGQVTTGLERKLADEERERLVAELRAALSRVKTLSGLLPICANCKKVRDDQGYWEQIEHYLEAHSQAEFTHGICPECIAKLYPGLLNGEDEKQPTSSEPADQGEEEALHPRHHEEGDR